MIAAAVAQATEQKSISLPQITAYNLEKTKVSLPTGFAAPVNLLILFFDQDRREDAQSWVPATTQLSGVKQNLQYYLLPVFSRENLLYRWWMNSSMRSSTPDSTTWKWTVPLYLNKQKFMESLDIHSEHEVTLLLVDKEGKVLWRSSGPFTQEKKTSLIAALSDTTANR
jgi:ATP10 protein